MNLSDVLINESAFELKELLRSIRCEPECFEFANILFEDRFRSSVRRILHLKNLAEGCYAEGDTAQADTYNARASEVERQFYAYLRNACLILSQSPQKADEVVCDADHILPNLINSLRLMGK